MRFHIHQTKSYLLFGCHANNLALMARNPALKIQQGKKPESNNSANSITDTCNGRMYSTVQQLLDLTNADVVKHVSTLQTTSTTTTARVKWNGHKSASVKLRSTNECIMKNQQQLLLTKLLKYDIYSSAFSSPNSTLIRCWARLTNGAQSIVKTSHSTTSGSLNDIPPHLIHPYQTYNTCMHIIYNWLCTYYIKSGL